MLHHESLNETMLAAVRLASNDQEKMPDHIREALLKLPTADLPTIGETLQSIYDVPVAKGGKETIGPALAQVAAAGLDVFVRSQFMVIGKPDKTGSRPAYRMRMALLRDAGEPASDAIVFPDPADDYPRRPLPTETASAE